MRFTNILRLTFVLALSAFMPLDLAAQGSGCPWCTTPTTCATLEESTPIAGCYNIGDGCQTISGTCNITASYAAAERATLLRDNGLEYRGETVAEIWGVKMKLIETNDGYFAEWACDGRLTAIFKKDRDGKFVELDVMRYTARFALTKGVNVLTTRAN